MGLPELVGLVPAAGQALRLGGLPGSKELLPIGFRAGAAGPEPQVPVLFREIERSSALGTTGGIHKNVDFPKSPDRFVEHALQRSAIRHV